MQTVQSSDSLPFKARQCFVKPREYNDGEWHVATRRKTPPHLRIKRVRTYEDLFDHFAKYNLSQGICTELLSRFARISCGFAASVVRRIDEGRLAEDEVESWINSKRYPRNSHTSTLPVISKP